MMDVIVRLQELTGKKHVVLCASGDHAIRAVLQYAKFSGKSRAFIPDQGGWLTYRDYAKKEGLQAVELKTDLGVMRPAHLAIDSSGLLLLNSLAAYAFEQPVSEIHEMCKAKSVLFVNDISGSIGRKHLAQGDVLLCSFGKDKPVNAHYGGCIATNDNMIAQALAPLCSFDQAMLPRVEKALEELPARLDLFSQVHDKIKNDLKHKGIVHRDSKGINVIVRYQDEAEKQELIQYCQQNKYPYTECPRYIRVLAPAISIETKRIITG